ncbi:MAG: futalosine hydrolase [Nannocystaceae bacterium]
MLLVAYAAAKEGDGLRLDGVAPLALGVGKTASASTLTDALVRNPEIRGVLLFGVCGAYRRRAGGSESALAVGDLCVVDSEWLADEGVDTPDGFLSLSDLDLGSEGGAGAVGPFAADQLRSAAAADQLGAPRVHGVTVSTCNAADTRAERVVRRSQAVWPGVERDLVETMEGAAVAWVCGWRRMPWLQVRCVSNWTGDRCWGQWQLETAIDRVQRAVRTLVTGAPP